MERVTYPDTEVQQLLERSYLRKVLDLELDAEAVSAFGVLGIPVAIIADADGLELDRIEGFVEPQDYARRLDGLAKR
ncbi:MAG: hypothetical protein H6841_04905 [Planctomycetes bacterium]|nr:hypothetical protein [Planctomycetota bacterium]MCB9934953.1 hypothetical protein [Planctomycetota bacterium]